MHISHVSMLRSKSNNPLLLRESARSWKCGRQEFSMFDLLLASTQDYTGKQPEGPLSLVSTSMDTARFRPWKVMMNSSTDQTSLASMH